MNRFCSLVACIAFLFMAATEVRASDDLCRASQRSDSRVRLSLERAYPERGSFVAVFKLENLGIAKEVRIPATVAGDTYFLRKPELWVEYKTLAGKWEPVPDLPRDNINSEVFSVTENSAAEFSARLMSQDLANLQASDFRVLISVFSMKLCIVSEPFRTVPVRRKAEGFESSPISAK